MSANLETATDTYETLAKRGETVVRKLRGEAAGTVAPADKTVVNKSTLAAKKAPAKKAPAKKVAAKKAPAKKATAKA